MADLQTNVTEWLSKQGFPLEFATAKALADQGFRTDQGAYVPDPKTGVLREIDVIASSETSREGITFRTSVVVECKWSKDKPWVVFTSASARPSAEEWIAYTVASPFGEAVMFKLADDPTLQELHRKVQPVRFGFAGRQAFTEKNEKDQFYQAVQGVVAASVSLTQCGVRPSVSPSTTNYWFTWYFRPSSWMVHSSRHTSMACSSWLSHYPRHGSAGVVSMNIQNQSLFTWSRHNN